MAGFKIGDRVIQEGCTDACIVTDVRVVVKLPDGTVKRFKPEQLQKAPRVVATPTRKQLVFCVCYIVSL